MKQVHNIRVRVHNSSREVVEAVLARADAMARRNEDDVIESTVAEEDGLVIGELWLGHQQPVRRFLAALLSGMSAEDKTRVHENPTKYMDVGTHCYLHCEREAFVAGKIILAPASGSVSIRLNIAAFPATREKAIAVLTTLFA